MYELLVTGEASFSELIRVSEAYNHLTERFMVDVMGCSLSGKGLNYFKPWKTILYKDENGFWFAKIGGKTKRVVGKVSFALEQLVQLLNTDIFDIVEIEVKHSDLYDISSLIDRKDVRYRLAFDRLDGKRVRVRGIETEINGLGWSNLLNQCHMGFSGYVNRWNYAGGMTQELRKKLREAYTVLNAEFGFVRILDATHIQNKIPKEFVHLDKIVLVDRVKYLMCSDEYLTELLRLFDKSFTEPARSVTWECDVLNGSVSTNCLVRKTEISDEYDYLIRSK